MAFFDLARPSPVVSAPALLLGCALVAPILAACGDQEADIRTLCELPARCASNDTDPEKRHEEVKACARSKMSSTKGKRLLPLLFEPGLDAKAKADLLRREAAAFKISPCPQADAWSTSTPVRGSP